MTGVSAPTGQLSEITLRQEYQSRAGAAKCWCQWWWKYRQSGRGDLYVVQHSEGTEYFIPGGSCKCQMRSCSESSFSAKQDGKYHFRWKQVLWSGWRAELVCLAVKTASFIREGLNVQEGLYCYCLPAWGYLVVRCSGSVIWELSLAPNFILFLLTPMFPCFFRNMNPNFEQVSTEEIKWNEGNHLVDWNIIWG